MSHAIVVPVEGLVQILHADEPFDPREVLNHTAAVLTMRKDGAIVGTMAITAFDYDEPNDRAAAVVLSLTGAHMIVRGTVGFTDIPEESLASVVAVLSGVTP